MYLSKVLITGPVSHNPYDVHQALWRLFPKDDVALRAFLFRVSSIDQVHMEVLLQSEDKPNQPTADVKVHSCKEYQLKLNYGQKLRFFLVANPVKTIGDKYGRKTADGEKKKCRVPLILEEGQRTWLERKFEGAASFDALDIGCLVPLRFHKAREGRTGKIQPVSFQGVLSVNDAERLVVLVKNGIGPAKAFGCGLLSLARAL